MNNRPRSWLQSQTASQLVRFTQRIWFVGRNVHNSQYQLTREALFIEDLSIARSTSIPMWHFYSGSPWVHSFTDIQYFPRPGRVMMWSFNQYLENASTASHVYKCTMTDTLILQFQGRLYLCKVEASPYLTPHSSTSLPPALDAPFPNPSFSLPQQFCELLLLHFWSVVTNLALSFRTFFLHEL